MTDSGERDGGREAAIEARLKAATPGEWICAPWSTGIVGPAAWCPNKGTCVAVVKNDRDKNFIAHAPEDMAYLLAELGRVRAERDAAREALKEIAQHGITAPREMGDVSENAAWWKRIAFSCMATAARELASRGARGGPPA